MGYPTSQNQVKETLEKTIEISINGLKADKEGDYAKALEAYASVTESLTNIIHYYARHPSIEGSRKRKLLEAKLEKYVERVSMLWDELPWSQKVNYSSRIVYKKQKSLPKQTEHSFQNINYTFMEIIRLEHHVLPVPTIHEDSMVSIMQRIELVSKSMKTGGYLNANVYIPAGIHHLTRCLASFSTKSREFRF